MLDKVPPPTLCPAPWTHTYISPQTERRMCCASREDAQNFKQYIDTGSHGDGEYYPHTLEDHWNGDHMRSVRRRMMAGEELPECDVCNYKLLNFDVYRTYFLSLFKHKIPEIYSSTDETGYTTMKPISWDYRISNLCNFKCRMCGDMLSSSWEAEQKTNNMVNWGDDRNNWMRPDIKKAIAKFQDTQVTRELALAIEEHRVEEIYWVGGEPLMYEQHWQFMKRLVELGDGPRLYARYNTNLSRVQYKGIDLFDDILSKIRDWQICASLDGTGQIGEYIRTGLDYDQWVENFKRARTYTKDRRQLRIDYTLTLPGIFELENIERLSAECDVDILAKVIFTFSPDIALSPLALPRSILNRLIDDTLKKLSNPTLCSMLEQLKSRFTFEEEWPDTYRKGIESGKRRLLKLESIRNDTYTIADIFKQREDVYDWWSNTR